MIFSDKNNQQTLVSCINMTLKNCANDETWL
jgi:hypothetical protein